MRPIVIAALLAGAGAGLGGLLILRELAPGVPALGPALRQLHTPGAEPGRAAPPAGPLAAIARRVRIPHRELALIGRSPERYVADKVMVAVLGLAFPPGFTLLLQLSGVALPAAVPAAAGLVLAVVLVLLIDVSVRQRATEARQEFARHVAVYLDLIALELAASRGPGEALERAAMFGGGWVSQRIREALHSARLRLESPWEGLRQTAAEIGVPELADVADIMTLVGDEGAQVYDTLRSRAASLRAALLAVEEERANTATTALYIPTSLLVMVLFTVAAYPMLARLITT